MAGPCGFTLTEVIVVLGIVGFLASIVFPVLAQSRRQAGLAQCTNNLRQLGQALLMYNVDHSSSFEVYPDRLTHLSDLGYVGDERVYVCPMDYTHATKDWNSGRTGLKPYFNANIPSNDYNYWAERNPPVSGSDWLYVPPGAGGGIIKTRNCSYIYEFRTSSEWLGTYTRTGDPTTVAWTSTGWASDTLVTQYTYNWGGDTPFGPDYASNPNVNTVEWVSGYDNQGNFIMSGFAVPANPMDVDRDGNGVITWQEAKFYQLQNADDYTTGYAAPGDTGVPISWSQDPWNECSGNDYMRQRSYPRSLMPIVRCFWHGVPADVDNQDMEFVLNLALDGNTFFSVPGWEQTAWMYGRGSSANPDNP